MCSTYFFKLSFDCIFFGEKGGQFFSSLFCRQTPSSQRLKAMLRDDWSTCSRIPPWDLRRYLLTVYIGAIVFDPCSLPLFWATSQNVFVCGKDPSFPPTILQLLLLHLLFFYILTFLVILCRIWNLIALAILFKQQESNENSEYFSGNLAFILTTTFKILMGIV